MWPTVYFGISNRSIRRRFRARAKGHGTRSHKYETARNDCQQHSRVRLVFVERRRIVVVDDGNAFHSRRRGRDSDSGGSRDRYHRSHNYTLLDGDLHRLQTPETGCSEEEEAEVENAADISIEEEREGGREITGVGYVSERVQRRWISNEGRYSLTVPRPGCFSSNFIEMEKIVVFDQT